MLFKFHLFLKLLCVQYVRYTCSTVYVYFLYYRQGAGVGPEVKALAFESLGRTVTSLGCGID